jgi:hypothetical protein
MRFYTGIGSRSTPGNEQAVLTNIASFLEYAGFVLRSGGAEGADKAFEAGVSQSKNVLILRPKHSTPEAEEIASQIHPMWSACNKYARQLHGRNVQLVLGENLDSPSEFVVAWTFDGKDKGGTRTGLVLAKQRGIPAFNLANDEDRIQFGVFLSSLRSKDA